MAATADKSAELQGLAVVGVDIDTVKSQLEEYKVSISNLVTSSECMITLIYFPLKCNLLPITAEL